MIRKSYGEEPAVFDEKTALMYSGDDPAMLSRFASDYIAQKKATEEKLNTAFADENWEDYAIFAHGLKSSSVRNSPRRQRRSKRPGRILLPRPTPRREMRR